MLSQLVKPAWLQRSIDDWKLELFLNIDDTLREDLPANRHPWKTARPGTIGGGSSPASDDLSDNFPVQVQPLHLRRPERDAQLTLASRRSPLGLP